MIRYKFLTWRLQFGKMGLMDLESSLKLIRNIIYKYLPQDKYRVFVYGSRACGTASKWSDIDVGILGEDRVPSGKLALISADIEDSDIPYLVDVVDFFRVGDKFKKVALRKVRRL